MGGENTMHNINFSQKSLLFLFSIILAAASSGSAQVKDATPKARPNDAVACNGQGIEHVEAGRYLKAIESFRRSIHLEPSLVDAHRNLAVVHILLGQDESAIEPLQQATRLRPEFLEAHFDLGTAYMNLGQFEKAVKTFKHVTLLKPDMAEAYNSLGGACLNLGRHEEAIEFFKTAIQLKPNYGTAYNNLGTAQFESGLRREAIQSLKLATKTSDSAEVHFNLGAVYSKMGQYTNAIELLKRAISLKPDFADAHFALALTYLVTKKKSVALDQYQILQSLNPLLASRLYGQIHQAKILSVSNK
jgi:tetratricopeptide (TPR) repeat protein